MVQNTHQIYTKLVQKYIRNTYQLFLNVADILFITVSKVTQNVKNAQVPEI